jgi:hypothetical protein
LGAFKSSLSNTAPIGPDTASRAPPVHSQGKDPKTIRAYEVAVEEFRQSCAKKFIDEIRKQDLLDFMGSPNPLWCANLCQHLTSFLHLLIGDHYRLEIPNEIQ